MTTIYQLASHRLRESEWIGSSSLEYLFSSANPWWIEPDSVVDPIERCSSTPEAYRTEIINELKAALPEGYELHGQRITVKNPDLYWGRVVNKMSTIAEEAKSFDIKGETRPLEWWKLCVDEQNKILIYFHDNEDLMTLNEFLLFLVNRKEDYQFMYIGGIYFAYEWEV